MKQTEQFKEAIRSIYSSVTEMRKVFPDRLFTPDGRMVGDIGEAIASLEYGVILDKKSQKHWDGHRIVKGIERKVQIKTTQKDETYLKKPPHEGDLLVFKIFQNGEWECCYDGGIMQVWNSLKDKKIDKTEAKYIKLNKFKELSRTI